MALTSFSLVLPPHLPPQNGGVPHMSLLLNLNIFMTFEQIDGVFFIQKGCLILRRIVDGSCRIHMYLHAEVIDWFVWRKSVHSFNVELLVHELVEPLVIVFSWCTGEWVIDKDASPYVPLWVIVHVLHVLDLSESSLHNHSVDQ